MLCYVWEMDYDKEPALQIFLCAQILCTTYIPKYSNATHGLELQVAIYESTLYFPSLQFWAVRLFLTELDRLGGRELRVLVNKQK
jgi:hypothetical protein